MTGKRDAVIQLWDDPHLFGLLIPCGTGILWSNQVGGTACVHPSVEGYFVPLPNLIDDMSIDPLRDHYRREYPHYERLAASFLEAFDLRRFFRLLAEKEYAKLRRTSKMIAEAWVPVGITEDATQQFIALESLIEEVGIITYANSD